MPVRYKPVKKNRLFTREVWYHEIDWNNWAEVIGRFEEQLRQWYVTPIEQLLESSPHNAFAAVALCCILVDALSQYEAGIERSDGPVFMDFVRRHLPSHGARFSSSIRMWNETKKKNQEYQAHDFAEVLWNGFRCGILHEAHAPLYGRLWGQNALFEFKTDGYCTYADTDKPCPTVNLNPQLFANEVIAAFEKFIGDLKGADLKRRAQFKKKFLVSYGIHIENEPAHP